MTTALDRLRGRAPVFSVEFFPPRSDDEERLLWRTIRELEPLDPAYISVTYGAGGSRRDRTIRTTARVATETTLLPVAHLTAVDHSVAELRNVIGWYAAVGVRTILAIRGDPPGDIHGEWVPHPAGLQYAAELVTLIRELGDFCVGVAASPYGHPRSPDLATDTEYLVRKLRAGADFAIAQLFFEAGDFLRLRDRVADRGCDAVMLPGVMPFTAPRTFAKAVELAGVPAPARVLSRLEPWLEDKVSFRAAGIDLATELCEELLAEGVPGLHFYTLNRSKATREVVSRLGLTAARV
ncbi:methylenetetrahydrofolate reductase (NADPH) [Actinokineospora baliensis]|uniref:methylenetetrahydrofolate reductase n=1 Tax=Actinokineospora baliensis TaxID=547056 RepID=UPI0019561E3A|nr:methylenetetrahydrofolate reductase [Actinokineospora baliensis]MBM7773190.1 methylenetetrahydrofolate reductase (NADPH) [Actinokineospora baliensis]